MVCADHPRQSHQDIACSLTGQLWCMVVLKMQCAYIEMCRIQWTSWAQISELWASRVWSDKFMIPSKQAPRACLKLGRQWCFDAGILPVTLFLFSEFCISCLFGWINVELIKWGFRVPSLTWLLIKNSNTMCTYLVNVHMQRNVKKEMQKKKEKTNNTEWLTWMSSHCICPMHGSNGRCWEDNVIKIWNILLDDTMSEWLTADYCHWKACVKSMHLLCPSPHSERPVYEWSLRAPLAAIPLRTDTVVQIRPKSLFFKIWDFGWFSVLNTCSIE